MTVFNNRGNTYCDGRLSPIVAPGDTIGIELKGFSAHVDVEVNATHMSGVTRNIQAIGTVVAGAVAPPPRVGAFQVNNVGSAYFDYALTDRTQWPNGCYTLQAIDVTGGARIATTTIAVDAKVSAQENVQSHPRWTHPQLDIVRQATGEAVAEAGQAVEIFGRGFGAHENIEIEVTEPDGSGIAPSIPSPFPMLQTNNAGEFYFQFAFDDQHPKGRYEFTATGQATDFEATTAFELAPRGANAPSWSILRVIVPTDGRDIQRTVFEVQGQRFQPGEDINIQITLPDGSIYPPVPHAVRKADAMGTFFDKITLNEALPVGEYSFTATGQNSGRVANARVILDAGPVKPPFTNTYPTTPQPAN